MGKQFPPQFEIEITSFNTEGAGVGMYGKRRVAIFGAIPGDVVLAKPLKVSRNHSKAQLIELISSSSHRRDVFDSHYPSSSPWQPLPYGMQLAQKEKMLTHYFKEKAAISYSTKVEPAVQEWGYRTKMEYGFACGELGDITLGLRKRNRWRDMYELHNAAIVPEKMNTVARHIVAELNKKNVQIDGLKSLIVRYSFYEQKCIAGLFVTNKKSEQLQIEHEYLKGFHLIYSDPASPVSKIDEVLSLSGEEFLTEKISGNRFEYHWNGFFQQNIKTFEKIIEYVSAHIPKGTKRLVDLYAGVGTFGISLSGLVDTCLSIELDLKASELTQKNAHINNVDCVDFYSSEVEHFDLAHHIHFNDLVIVDPPRAGLHPSVVHFLIEDGPKVLMYVSCNPKTQAIDYAALKKRYTIKSARAFDLYPQTPHIENVLILHRL